MESENPGPRITEQALDNICALALNQRIVSLPTFLCKVCEKFLSRPIMLVPNVGNVCGSCINGEETKRIHNHALESVLDILLVPCRFFDKGCAETLPYTEISKHMSMCCYRNYSCPLKLFGGCPWEGSINTLLQHGVLHDAFILANIGNTVKLTLDISKDNEIINLVNIEDNSFILHIKYDIQSLKQRYGLYYMGMPNKAADFSYSVVLTNCNGLDSIQLCSSNALSDADFTNEIHRDVTEVDLSLIKQFIKDEGMLVEITIDRMCETEEVQTEMLSGFECPICNLFMRPPIFQCLSGHSICNRCRPQLHQCPVCRSGFGSTRNFILESISVNLKFPCMYGDAGCRALLKHCDADKHEAQCLLKSYSCPFNESEHCVWLGPLDGIVNHLQMHHLEKVVFSKYHRVTVPFSNSFSMYCMVVNGDVFRVCYKRNRCNQNLYWAVQFIGPTDLAHNYTNEIGLIDGRVEQRKLVRFESVQQLSSVDNMFNQCVMLPFPIMVWFGSDGELTYYCKIAKIK